MAIQSERPYNVLIQHAAYNPEFAGTPACVVLLDQNPWLEEPFGNELVPQRPLVSRYQMPGLSGHDGCFEGRKGT